MGQKLFVIDVMPILYRGHFVFLKSPRLTSTGINTSALNLFAMTVAQILAEHEPSHVALVLDSTTPTFRHQEYPAYKAQRQKTPEDITAALPMAIELAKALNIPMLRVEGFEADDLMGALATCASREGLETYLVTPDKDIAQLVDATTRLYRPGKAGVGPEILTVDDVCRHWDIASPAQMVDYLGLAGDDADNIPGITGIGEKTAVALLKQFGSLDAVLDGVADIKGKLAEKVAGGREQALISRRLATIRRDVPLPVTLADLARREPDREALHAVLAKYELLQVGQRLLGGEAVARAAQTEVRTIRDTPHAYTCASGEAGVAALLAALREAPLWAFDTETTGLEAWQTELVGISFSTQAGTGWYLPVPADPAAREALLARFRPLFEDPSKTRIAHNAKFDLTVLRHHGIRVAGTLHDTLLTHYVLDAAERHGLDHLSRQYLGYDPIPITALIGERGPGQITMREVPLEQAAEYAAEDADIALRLHEHLRPLADEAGCARVLQASEEPLIAVLIAMEAEGIRLDPAALKACGRELERDLLELELKIREYAGGGSFNLASPKQMGELLFGQLKLDPDAKRTASGQYATDEDTLLRLAGKHPIVDLILDHRACSKLKNTYVEKLPESIHPQTGRIHTTFSQAMTETGRLSSVNPNLQNIPIRTARGRRVRAAFVPRDAGHVLLSADYSQVELRVMAAMSGDRGMIEAFARGADIHTETAARVHGILPALVTAEMRSQAKMVNFGIIYGISAFGLSQRLGIPRKQAADLIEHYFEQYPGVKTYMDATIAGAREHGYVTTHLGRRRWLRDITSRNATSRQAAERNAINTPIQGTAADLIKLAMVRIQGEIEARGLRARMVLQVHDELVFDVPRDEIEAVRTLVTEAMRNALDLGVPLDVETGVGENWLEAH
jgi:DNA polymerase-1